jgi:CHAT domain-containing protein
VLGVGVSEAKTVRVSEAGGTRDIPFSALPAVRAELNSIVRNEKFPGGLLPGLILLDAEFNVAGLKKELSQGYNVVHIASHFSLNAGDVTKSFLLMGDGRALTVSEISASGDFKFDDVELLTLSACRTAVGERDGTGKEIEGFGYVAQEKGAKAILATLWGVADESTQLLMSEFYRLRKERPALTKAKALQLAQRGMMEGRLRPSTGGDQRRETGEMSGAETGAPAFAADPQKPYAHPFYWSPFILIGNWK